jgi:hypothetical protein
VFVPQPPVLEMVPQMLFCSCLSKGKNKIKWNHTKQKKPTKCPKFKCNTVSVSFSACRHSSVVVSSKVGREKRKNKKSPKTVLWMAIYGCGLPACCCQPAVAGGFIYADLWGELSTHLALQALFTQSSVHDATATSFPLSKHTGGGDTAPAFWGWCVYLQFTWEVGLPLSPVKFSSLCHFYRLSWSWLLGICHCSCLLIYLQFCERFSSPPSALRVPQPLRYMSLLFLLLIWPRVVCGSTMYCLAHLVVHIFPSCLGASVWQYPGGCPGFSL